MARADRLKRDHEAWQAGGLPSHELLIYQDQLLMAEMHMMRSNRISVKEMLETIISRHPAKNGFITTHDADAPWPAPKSKIQPEDGRKVAWQLREIAQKYSGRKVWYHPYRKVVRVHQVDGTFADNDRDPQIGQRVWLQPGVAGTVVRTSRGVTSLLNSVDVRMDATRRIMTLDREHLFDHEPRIVVYNDPSTGQKIQVWE